MAEVVRTAMARDPDARYATASEFREALLAAAKTPAQRPPVEKPKVDEEPPEQVAQTKLAVAEAKKSRRRISRKVAAIAGGLLLIAAAAGGAGFALSSGGGSLAQTVTHLGGVNNDVAVGNDGIVADGTPDGTPEVLTVDPSTRKVVRTVDLPASFQPGPLAVGGGKTWVIDVEHGDLAAVGKTGTPDVQHVRKRLSTSPGGRAASGRSTTGTSTGSTRDADHHEHDLDTTDGFAPAPALSLTYGDGSMWVLTSLGEIDAFNAVTTDLVAQKQVGLGQNGCLAGSCITFGAGHVWALNGVVYGIDSASNRVTSASGPRGRTARAATMLPDTASRSDSVMSGRQVVLVTRTLRIDPRTRVSRRLPIATSRRRCRRGAGAVWPILDIARLLPVHRASAQVVQRCAVRNRAGVIPKRPLKARVKWLWSTKPASTASRASGTSELTSFAAAHSTRSRRTHSPMLSR